MKKLIFIIFILLFILSTLLSKQPFQNLIYEDKSLYIAIFVGSRMGELDYTLPVTKICQLYPALNGEYGLKPVQIFNNYDKYEHILIKSYNKYRFLYIIFADYLTSPDCIYYELNIIPMNKPSEKIIYPQSLISISEDIFPFKIENKTWLAIYDYENPNNIRLYNINTFQSKKITSDLMKKILLEGDLLIIKDSKLTFKRIGLGEFTLPFAPPPSSILEDIKRLRVILDSDKFLVTSSLYHLIATNQRNKEQMLFILNKQKKSGINIKLKELNLIYIH